MNEDIKILAAYEKDRIIENEDSTICTGISVMATVITLDFLLALWIAHILFI
jgi:hypothetical protein